jgi:NAD(P)-dependent dehydrogenase (short-subunit alcohol dehydrogenase family)
MRERTVVITGGNTGLGYACAAALLASKDDVPWRVILACRSHERGQEAASRLERTAGAHGHVEAMTLDLASLASVRVFASELAARVGSGEIPPPYGLVCNAGVQSWTTRSFTADGFEATFGVNHLGHFLLVKLLLPVLNRSARIVVVASGVHDPTNNWGLPAPAWNDTASLCKGKLGAEAAYDKAVAYGQRLYTTSKLANIYFTYALARRLPPGITANAFDPGLTPGTGLTRDAPAPIRFIAKHILPRAIPLLRHHYKNSNVHSLEDSGRSMARLLIDPELAGTTGKYYQEWRQVSSSPESYDEARAEELWEASKTITGVS